MASSKRPAYIVETKLVAERKRRNSDLVIMWQSIWDVTSIVTKELWTTILRMWELIQLWFSSSERFEMQAWLEKYLPYVPDDFSDSWRDGRLLAILLNKLQPGCFPDAHQLDPDYGLRNVYKAFGALEVYFGIKPTVSVEEIVTCIEGSDAKLYGILLELKQLNENQPEAESPPETEPKENIEHDYINQSCIAKGTGLAVGFVGRLTNFIIFCAFISDIDVVIEIKGPNTICSERITKRSPKKKRSVSFWDYPRPLIRSVSFHEEENHLMTEEEDNLEKRIISLEYEIIGNQISVGYKPKEMGQHKVSILWHGQHVSDSPYFVAVEDPLRVTANNIYQRRSALKTANGGEKTESRKNSVRFQESQVRYKDESKSLGRVLSKRILRYIVKINGKDIPVNAQSTDSLATELLKMEYDFETCPSSHRRNSWGFTGDAERKKSVIRQFGIDINELEAQNCLRRTRSLSINPGSKRLLEKSDSFDNISSRLNIVNEDLYECCEIFHENESDYAYIHESAKLENELENNEDPEIQTNSSTEKYTESLEFPIELLQNNSEDNSDQSSYSEMESKMISSLSTETSLVHTVDNLNDDQISLYGITSVLDTSSIESPVKMSFNCDDPNSERNNDNNHNKGNDYGSQTFKYPKGLVSVKFRTNQSINTNSNRTKYTINKYCVRTKKTKRLTKKSSCNKCPRNTNSVLVPQNTSNRNFRRYKTASPKAEQHTSMNVLECLKQPDAGKLKCQRNREEINRDPIESALPKISNIFSTTDKTIETNNSLSDKAKCTGDNEESAISQANQTFRNIIDPERTKDSNEDFKCDIQRPQTKENVLAHNVQAELPPITLSQVNFKDKSYQKPKILRTHTLKTVEQFHFKQFNPPVDPESCISPIKSQIVQWESTLSTENQKSPLKRSNTSETEQVSIKEKLAFWEKACKAEQNSITRNTLENNRKAKSLDNNMTFQSVEGNTKAVNNDLRNVQGTGKTTSISNEIIIREKTVSKNSINKQTNLAAKKDIDIKITPELQVGTDKIRKRSFSDPGVSKVTTPQNGNLSDIPSLDSSTTGYFDSSIDDNLEYFSDDTDDFDDDFQNSTGDGYIDDEISGSASEYWGDLGIVKGLKVAQCTIEDSLRAPDYIQNHQLLLKSFPDECKVFGIAVYYGYVAEKNRFQVYTGDAGFGNLSVSVQGFRRYDVSLVSVAYVRKDIYEVTYQVMTSGYYLISVRWLDKEVPGSPFVCKVTF